MPTDAEIVGNRIRKLRENKAWSQREFATRIACGRSQIVRWENGYDMPRIHKRDIIANALDQKPEVLFHVGAEREAQMEDHALATMLELARNANAPPSVQLAAAKSLRPKAGPAKSAASNALEDFRKMMEQADADLTRILEELDAEEAQQT